MYGVLGSILTRETVIVGVVVVGHLPGLCSRPLAILVIFAASIDPMIPSAVTSAQQMFAGFATVPTLMLAANVASAEATKPLPSRSPNYLARVACNGGRSWRSCWSGWRGFYWNNAEVSDASSFGFSIGTGNLDSILVFLERQTTKTARNFPGINFVRCQHSRGNG